MEKIIEKYSNLLSEKLNSQIKLLLESFVLYYGEENRNIIEEKFKKTEYIFYINSIGENNKSTPLYQSNLIENYPTYIQDNINFIFNNHGTCCISDYDQINNTDYHIIVINLTKNSGDRSLIHEINHTIGNETLLVDDKKVYRKSGLKTFNNSMVNDSEKKLDELFNELSAKKIYDIFKSKGGNILDDMIPTGIKNIYFLNSYLVEDIFSLVEQYYKESKTTINKNRLIKMCGIENYNLLLIFLSRYYSIHQDIILTNSTDLFIKRKKEALLEKIKENIQREKEIDYEYYFSFLKRNGHKVRRLGVNNG